VSRRVKQEPGEPDAARWSELTWLGRLVAVVTSIAYLVLAAWFAWPLLGGRDSIPPALNAASAVAAVIVIADAGVRILKQRRARDRPA
jgi:hypothetical protein